MTTDTFAQNKLPETIVKRNGTEDRFDRSKISMAIYNALRATGEYEDTDINEFTGKLLKSVLRELKTRNDGKLHVEDVQDIIEDKLMDKGLHKTARYFIKYRFLHKINRDKIEGTTLIDCNQTTEEYIGFSDWRIKANANTTYSNAGLVNNTAGKVVANYWLDKIYSPEEGAAHRNGDYHIHDLDCLTGYCFTGDTRVALLDGTNPTFTELVDMYGDGKPFWVISRDKDGNIVPGNAHHPRLIKKNAELMEITISGGAKIVCTPDHEFMLRDGSYRQAKDLRSRESLMPFYSSKKGAGYVFVRDAKKGIAEYLHRLVGAWKEGITDMRGLAVHHINGNKCDNRPENLEVMVDGEHRAMELAETMTTDVWKSANNARMQEYNRSEEKRRAVSEFASNRKRNEKGEFYNHTVVSKRYLEDLQDVYCLTVDEHENFALEAGVFVHNCAGWNLRTLLSEGFNGVRSRVNSRPPKHFREALGQMANFLGILQSEWAGAQAFSSFDTFLAPYVFRDKLPYIEVKKAIRSFVYNLNVPSRWGQSPFTNVTIDWTVPADLREDMPIRGCVHLFDDVKEDPELIEKAKERGVASPDDMSYKHFQPEMNVIQKAYYEVMTEGDSTGQPFTFPIPTVNITEDFDWEGENVPILFENAAKIGSSYFQNFIGSQYKYDENGNRVEDEEAYKPSAVRSMCCRLQLDLTELRKRGNGLFGSAESTGSIGVVTINLARLGYRFKGDKEGLYKELDRLMNMAKSTLEKKRKLIAELYDRGLYPYTKRYLPGGFMNHFSTIGVNGGNEMIRNFTNDEQDITTAWGAKFAEDLLNHIRERMKEFQKETGNLYNLEATPAEGTTHRFAREDAKRYPDIIQAGKPGQNYYTNSSQLPSWYTQDLFRALKMQDNLQTRYTGGTVFHMYMNEAISSPEACRDIVRKVLTNFKMPYITVTPLFSVCEKHGYLRGQHDHCPLCDEEILAKYSE